MRFTGEKRRETAGAARGPEPGRPRRRGGRRSSGFEANAISHVIVDFIFFSLAKWIAFTEKRFVQYGRNDKPTS